MEGALQDRGTFRGIALTLVALATIAERAAGRSLPVRFLVLAILCRAETIARAFVARATGADWPCFDEPPSVRGGPADAGILALRLRMLAAVLCLLADTAGGSAGEDPRPGGAARLPAILPVILVVSLPAARCRRSARPHDTS